MLTNNEIASSQFSQHQDLKFFGSETGTILSAPLAARDAVEPGQRQVPLKIIINVELSVTIGKKRERSNFRPIPPPTLCPTIDDARAAPW